MPPEPLGTFFSTSRSPPVCRVNDRVAETEIERRQLKPFDAPARFDHTLAPDTSGARRTRSVDRFFGLGFPREGVPVPIAATARSVSHAWFFLADARAGWWNPSWPRFHCRHVSTIRSPSRSRTGGAAG